MKTLLLLGAIALSINVYAQSTTTVKIVYDLEVMTEDLGEMSWDYAMETCETLRFGWRLPTIEELKILYKNKDKIGGFVTTGDNYYYWSSTEKNAYIVKAHQFDVSMTAREFNAPKTANYRVRAVRSK
ncbi:DUF1566 domain-containing protein [Crocinitomicaceae bacterium]|nr:DUF1566 domain-containing protein [Crocinitomicaceae bacterium]